MARDMGLDPAAANEAFAVLDDDDSGYITYTELIDSLQTHIPRNADTKKLLLGCIWSAHDHDQRRSSLSQRRASIDAERRSSMAHDVDGGRRSSQAERRGSVSWDKARRATVTDLQCRQQHVVDTSRWRMHSSDNATDVLNQLRQLLISSSAHVTDLGRAFDEDAGNKIAIDEGEFMTALRRWGFRGLPAVVDQVFAAINVSRSGKIDYDELFEFVRGRRHALDTRDRCAKVRAITIGVPAGAAYTLEDVAWEVRTPHEARESTETLRILMQQTLLAHNSTPSDLLRAWDRSGDRQLSRGEFAGNVGQLFRKHPELWKREVHPVALAAFNIIQQDGSDVDSTAIDVIEVRTAPRMTDTHGTRGAGMTLAVRTAARTVILTRGVAVRALGGRRAQFEQWLDEMTRRKPDRLVPLKAKQVEPPPVRAPKQQPIVVRPGCDIASRALAAIASAKKAAVERMEVEAEAEKVRASRWEQSHRFQRGGQKWERPPMQRWEIPPSVASSPRYISSARQRQLAAEQLADRPHTMHEWREAEAVEHAHGSAACCTHRFPEPRRPSLPGDVLPPPTGPAVIQLSARTAAVGGDAGDATGGQGVLPALSPAYPLSLMACVVDGHGLYFVRDPMGRATKPSPRRGAMLHKRPRPRQLKGGFIL
jgi:Ca2+-binding EF-hand superfamily protein